MLSVLTRTMRFKAAVFLAVLYACTVLAPHAVMAFAGPSGLEHCLQQEKSAHDHGSSSKHTHADGTVHSHANDGAGTGSDDSKGPAAACCGLFSTNAMVSDARVELPRMILAARIALIPPSPVAGQGPDRINRPPIA